MLKTHSLLLFSLFSLQGSNKPIAYCMTEKACLILHQDGKLQYVALHAVDKTYKNLLPLLQKVDSKAQLIKMLTEILLSNKI